MVAMRLPAWWSRSAFFEMFRQREIDTGNPSYVDYGYLLTPGEAMAFDRQCREMPLDKLAASGDGLEMARSDLESALKGARWVIVESFEWESGLD